MKEALYELARQLTVVVESLPQQRVPGSIANSTDRVYLSLEEFNALISVLRNIGVDIENLAATFDATERYEITAVHPDIPDDCQSIETVLPMWYGDLCISAQSKLAVDRSHHEKSALALLPECVQEVYAVIFREVPHLTSRHMNIRKAKVSKH